MRKKAIIDKFINNYLSRKLIVFLITTFGLFSGVITSSDFIIIASIYIGTQGVLDIVSIYKSKGGNDGPEYQ
jgi:hypothetical protein